MNKIVALWMSLSLLSGCQTSQNNDSTLKQIPSAYKQPAQQAGTIERLDYTTYESMNYDEKTQELIKTAYV